MTDKTDNWSRSWKSSENPSKQRKYRRNAPLHVKDNLISANVSPELREELGTRSISLRTGDRVEIMRGDDEGASGIVSNIDRENEKIYIDGVTVERTDGTEREKPLRPSNLQIQALNVEDNRRLEKYEISEVTDIRVEEEEMEEALAEDEENEMMQQMQKQQDVDHEEDKEPETEEIETEDTEQEAGEDEETEADNIDYEKTVSGTIDEVKDAVSDDTDIEAVIKAEKENKNRSTLIDWLESQKE